MKDKIIEIQSTLNAPKNQRNNFGNYNYRSCEDILTALKPLLAKHGLLQTITDDVQFVGERVYVKATVTVSDGNDTISVCAFARESLDKKGMDTAQITGSASSYARKYALNGMWLIDDTKDPDTNEQGNQTRNAPVAPPPPPKKPALTPQAPKGKDGQPVWDSVVQFLAGKTEHKPDWNKVKAKYAITETNQSKLVKAVDALTQEGA